MKEKPNIRPPAERYGGQGHAGDDPFAGERAGHADILPDPSVMMPDATLEQLVELPDSVPEGNKEASNEQAERPESDPF